MSALDRRRKRWSWLLLAAFALATAGSAASVLGATQGCCPSDEVPERCDWITPAACCDGRLAQSAPPPEPVPPQGMIVPLPHLASPIARSMGFEAPTTPAPDLLALSTVVLRC